MSNNKFGDFAEDAFEKGQQVVTQTVKNVSGAVKAQIAPTTTPQSQMPSTDAGTSGDQSLPTELAQLENSATQKQQATPQANTASHQKPTTDNSVKTPAEQSEMDAVRQELRKQLHMETYYNPTFNPPKQEEEHVTEKAEREEQQEQFELQQKEDKKPAPLAVQQGQQSAEKYRGASG